MFYAGFYRLYRMTTVDTGNATNASSSPYLLHVDNKGTQNSPKEKHEIPKVKYSSSLSLLLRHFPELNVLAAAFSLSTTNRIV